jgi:hypothetical protein
LTKISSIYLQSKEHDAGPQANMPIQISDKLSLFFFGPFEGWIKNMAALILRLLVKSNIIICYVRIGKWIVAVIAVSSVSCDCSKVSLFSETTGLA